MASAVRSGSDERHLAAKRECLESDSRLYCHFRRERLGSRTVLINKLDAGAFKDRTH
jgi:hypothetical protein